MPLKGSYTKLNPDSDVIRISDTFIGHRNVMEALNTIFITYIFSILKSNTFSINYKKADSDFSNSTKKLHQIYG